MATLSAWALSSVITDLCFRAGLDYDKVNVNGLDGTVEGFYASSAHPVTESLESLARVFFFDTCSFDGVVNFVKRGLPTVADIELNDLVDDGKDVSKIKRKDNITIPRIYNFEYYDINGGLSVDKQTSDRSLDSRSKSEIRLESTVLMDADQAARTVVINHKIAIEEQRGEKEFALPDNWIWLTVGDVVNLMGDRVRITEIEISDGFQSHKGVFDRRTAYESTITGVQPGVPTEAPTLIVGNTTLEFIDTHILRDTDDRLGYYVGMNGSSAAWRGALIELSLDGGATYPYSLNSSIGCVIGTLTEVLPTHRVEYPDERNTLTVQLLRSTSVLSNSNLQEMMNRVNLAIVGDELINFADATEVEDGIWELSYLLRGRKGSTAVQHEIGERFVLLERSKLGFIDAELYELNRDLTFRATTYGATNSTTKTVTFLGRSQTERTAAYLKAVRDGGDIDISWQGVGRLGGGATVGMGAYFTGYRVTIRWSTWPYNFAFYDTMDSTITVTDPGGDVQVSVLQKNSLTGADGSGLAAWMDI